MERYEYISAVTTFCPMYSSLYYYIRRLNESTLELVEKYNDVISTIAETFVRYDEMLRALEDAKSTKTSVADS